MSIQVDPIESQSSGRPWYLLWVVGALALAGANIAEFFTTGRLSSVVLCLAWLLWAFCWYARPLRISFRARWTKAVSDGDLRTWVSPSLFNFAQLGALVLLLIGLLVRFTSAA